MYIIKELNSSTQMQNMRVINSTQCWNKDSESIWIATEDCILCSVCTAYARDGNMPVFTKVYKNNLVIHECNMGYGSSGGFFSYAKNTFINKGDIIKTEVSQDYTDTRLAACAYIAIAID